MSRLTQNAATPPFGLSTLLVSGHTLLQSNQWHACATQGQDAMLWRKANGSNNTSYDQINGTVLVWRWNSALQVLGRSLHKGELACNTLGVCREKGCRGRRSVAREEVARFAKHSS